MKKFSIVVAMDENQGIGSKNAVGMPWRLKSETKHFRHLTTGYTNAKAEYQNAVIMGRTTWDSLHPSCQPLPRRFNIILSQKHTQQEILKQNFSQEANVTVCKSLEEALGLLHKMKGIDQVFVIGGGQVYYEALYHPLAQYLYVSTIHSNCPGLDIFFPRICEKEWVCVQKSYSRTKELDLVSKKELEWSHQVYVRHGGKAPGISPWLIIIYLLAIPFLWVWASFSLSSR